MIEQEIIKSLKEGDKKAFQILYDHYWQQVYNFTKLYITTTMDTEEVVQEVFVKIWESRASLDETKSFDGFLFIVTRNLIFNHSRRHLKEMAMKVTVLQAIEESYDIEEDLGAADLKKYIDKLVLLLPPRQQEVFRMSRELHMSNREIAENLSVTEKAIERNMNLALKFLKKNLQLFVLFMA